MDTAIQRLNQTGADESRASNAGRLLSQPAAPVGRHVSADAACALTHWLRRTHRWFGLWGATFGLLVGSSGVWLNHRAVLKLPIAQEVQGFADRPARAAACRPASDGGVAAHGLATRRGAHIGARRKGPARGPGRTGGERHAIIASAVDAARTWIFAFGGPQSTLLAELWAGNHSVPIRRIDSGLIGTLTNLHKGIGMPVAWIILVDTLAGCLIFLSISGVLLWWQTRRRHRREGLILAMRALIVAGLALSRL